MILTYLWSWNSQGYQTWYKLLDPNQGYDHAKFERPALNSVQQKANVNYLTILKSFKLNQIWALNFHWKLLNIAVTLKYAQGHWSGMNK